MNEQLSITATEQKTRPSRKDIRKARYRRFLDASDVYPYLTFKEFLTNPYFKEAREVSR